MTDLHAYLRPIPFQVAPFSDPRADASRDQYDALIASIGYEERSRFAAQELASHTANIIAFGFENLHVLSYDANRSWFEQNGRVIDEPEVAFRKALGEVVAQLAEVRRQDPFRLPQAMTRPLRIAVDISSMTRQRIADAMLALLMGQDVSVEVDWIYAPATFQRNLSGPSVIRVNEPAHGFEGWGDPVRPVTCIVGAGFEGDLALGVIDDLEPRDTWMWRPHGYSAAHDANLFKVNEKVFDAVLNEHLLDYRVDQPYETYLRLASLCDLLGTDSRVVLLPLGPKLFALLCFVVALSDRRNIAVWRASADVGRSPVQCKASGDIFGMRTASPTSNSRPVGR